MPLIPFYLIVLVSAFILVTVVGCTKTSQNTNPFSTQVSVSKIQSLSQAEILEMLKRIETTKPPKPTMGAMCYSMAGPPRSVEYICPKCGEKTLYTNNQVLFIAYDLDSCRREFQFIQKSTDLLIKLDESSYCAHCSPDATEHSISLSITYNDGTIHKTPSIALKDLELLKAFLKGELAYETFNDGTEPLRNQLPRLEELLGVDSKEKGKN